MKNRKMIAVIMLTLCMAAALVCSAFITASAVNTSPLDVGNYNSYSGGGSNNYSGGNSYSGNSYSGNSSYSSGSSDSDSSSGIGGIGIGVIVVIIILVAVFGKKGKGGSSTGGNVNAPMEKPQNHTGEIIMAIQQIDPDFSETKFIAFTKQTFITLQQAWTARDWSIIRPLEKEELYTQHQQQLQEYINLKRINVIERINVGDTYLHLYTRDNQHEYLTVFMATRMVDYIIDENTKQVLKGDPNTDCYMDYLLTFMRKTGVKTQQAASTATSKMCPHCGAPLQVTSAGKCEYCDSIITTGEFDWVLSDMDAVHPGLTINNAGVVLNDAQAQQQNQQNDNNNNTPNT